MSRQHLIKWTCDRCDREVTESDDLPLMPYGWVHTMMGDDLCEECVQ